MYHCAKRTRRVTFSAEGRACASLQVPARFGVGSHARRVVYGRVLIDARRPRLQKEEREQEESCRALDRRRAREATLPLIPQILHQACCLRLVIEQHVLMNNAYMHSCIHVYEHTIHYLLCIPIVKAVTLRCCVRKYCMIFLFPFLIFFRCCPYWHKTGPCQEEARLETQIDVRTRSAGRGHGVPHRLEANPLAAPASRAIDFAT